MDVKTFRYHLAYPCSFPGGYNKVFLDADNRPVCMSCARDNAETMTADIQDDMPTRPVRIFANWEDDTLTCDDCGELIPPEYSDD